MSGISSEPNQTPFAETQVMPGFFADPRWMHRIFYMAVELLFPPCCGGCGRIDSYWCAHCQHEIDQMPFIRVANPIPPLAGVAATGVHVGKLREAVHALKYANSPLLADTLGNRLAADFRLLDWHVDLIVPVPLHAARLEERGYNQAQLLADRLAIDLEIPSAPGALRRERYTNSQVGLNSKERLTNVADAFRSSPSLVLDKNLLLVDDVYTTGATLSACAQAALAGGARAVYAITVSSAHG